MRNLINITDNKGTFVVTSRQVAEDFEKRHDNVLRDIENLISENSILRSQNYFIESHYKVIGNNKKYKEYLLTKDGFSLLVMGFTGPKALDWKLKYIQAFNKLENKYKEDLLQLQNEAFKEITMLKLQMKQLENKVSLPVRIGKHEIDTFKVINFINELAGYGDLQKDIHYKINNAESCIIIDFKKIYKLIKINYPDNELFKPSSRSIESALEKQDYCLENGIIVKLLDEKTYCLQATHAMILDIHKLEYKGIYLDNMY